MSDDAKASQAHDKSTGSGQGKTNNKEKLPEFTRGLRVDSLDDGQILRGEVDGQPALAVKRGDTIRFVGATCTHYGLPLDKGLVDGEEIRCSFHHARFCLKTGAALAAPAMDPIPTWDTVIEGNVVRAVSRDRSHGSDDETRRTAGRAVGQDDAGNKNTNTHASVRAQPIVMQRRESGPAGKGARAEAYSSRVLIIGGGGAGHAAATMLRDEGHNGDITILSAERSLPYDRPSCSKTLLTGDKSPADVALHSRDYYNEHRIALHTGVNVQRIDTGAHSVFTADGKQWDYDKLVIATGAEPKPLKIPGARHPHVLTLRTLDDARRLLDACSHAKRAVVIGASFIGLESAASLRTQGLEVDIVAPAPLPMERLLGKPVSDRLRALHESHGVRFHVGVTADAIRQDAVELSDGSALQTDIVLVGVGVTPRTALAQAAGLKVDDGIIVDAQLRTSAPDVYAAGDVARWPNPLDGSLCRIEHWVVAERQGQAVARSILGLEADNKQVPFFWSMQYGMSLGYVGHIDSWDHSVAQGSLADDNWSVTYYKDGEPRAMALVKRNMAGLKMERELERRMQEQVVGM